MIRRESRRCIEVVEDKYRNKFMMGDAVMRADRSGTHLCEYGEGF